MREELEKLYNWRDRFYGKFERFGTKTNYKTGKPEKTLLLLDIRTRSGKVVTDHLWFNFTKGFEKVDVKKPLKQGDLLRFDARVRSYTKGYEKDQFDYKLSFPSNIVKVNSIKFKNDNNGG